MQRQHCALRQQRIQVHERHTRRRLRRPVPCQHPHAGAARDSRDLRRDAAVAEKTDGLAGEFHALGTEPLAGPQAAVHCGDPARGGPHQGDGVFGHRRVAVAFDDVDGDADLGQLLGVHVAARAGAEEHDMLQAFAQAHRRRRHLRVIVQHEIVARQQPRQFGGCDIPLLIDIHRRVPRLGNLAADVGEVVHGVDEQALHGDGRSCMLCRSTACITPRHHSAERSPHVLRTPKRPRPAPRSLQGDFGASADRLDFHCRSRRPPQFGTLQLLQRGALQPADADVHQRVDEAQRRQRHRDRGIRVQPEHPPVQDFTQQYWF